MVDFVDNLKLDEAFQKGRKDGHDAAQAPEIQQAYDDGYEDGFEEYINSED